MGGSVNDRRRYTSPARREQARKTRRAILDAAHRLFAEKGYLATSVEDIAREAGVARPTVFTSVGVKSQILKEVIDLTLAGDDEPVPVRERPWFREALEEPDPHRMLHLHARNMRMMYVRCADVYCAVESAAEADPDVGALWQAMQRWRLMGSRFVAESLAGKTRLRDGYDADTVADMLWSVATPMVYRKLVRERGWSPEQYERWLADLLCRALLPD
ncbi:Transcriptional regulator [Carbonactinospora thermoautotrophica]|uniref:Transcriptional regulator n=1 Tax=Carbonactinospora thermoautotrophica TaxID=1469144 RepID=A0A132MQ33_9ACTN|nr:TetR/AcrR family transcriptional regulator [Carbonactinospora thermoautotrophica]KWW99977.1 Transcriptional regulator [Carbonactinospora thermoautotrophica]